MYPIKTIQHPDHIDQGTTVPLTTYNWGGEYRPTTTATLCWLEGKGFLIRMLCTESNPRATFTPADCNCGVCRDSCLEFFANFAPDQTGSGYLNFECNANGSLLCCYGPDRHQRKTVIEMGLPHPIVTPLRTAEQWGWELLIPLSMLAQIYGITSFHTGDVIKGNFYKCGDDTPQPHYGSYTEIQAAQPDFHRPECFASMQIVD